MPIETTITKTTKARAAKNISPINKPMPNGFFKKQVFSFGLCFSWLITIFCLLFGDAQNTIHSLLSLCSFLTGAAFTFALVFNTKINTAFFNFFKQETNNDKSN